MVLQKEYLNVSCHIQSPTNQPLCVGRIATIGDNYVILTKTSEDFPPLRFLSFVKMTLTNSVAGYKVILASVTESTTSTLRLSSLNLLTDDERRGYFRVHFETKSKLYLCENIESILDSEDEIANARAHHRQPVGKPINVVDCTIKNMSLSGLLIECPTFLRLGQRIVVELETKKKTELFLISVRRRLQDEIPESEFNGKELLQYGCMIHEKSNSKMDELCRTILEKQASIIQKMKR